MLSYADALRSIFRRTDYERSDRPTVPYAERAWRLERMHDLLSALGNPQGSFRSIHIAGTKGKGSTTAMIESILRAAGYRTGMFTSPHLHTFRERIRVDGALISEEDVERLVERLAPALATRHEVTVFEIITAMAMLHFAEQGVQWGVFEVGMGGRLDATNVLVPEVAVITSISLDHMKVLGDTLEAIAGEKSGIIKRRTAVVSAPQDAAVLGVIQAKAAEEDAPLTLVGRDWTFEPGPFSLQGQYVNLDSLNGQQGYEGLWLPLLGTHQLENAATAVAAVEVLREHGVGITREAVRQGLASVCWPGRLELLCNQPLLVVDGAHNAYSMQRLLEALRRHFSFERLLAVFGAGVTHEPATLLEALLPCADEVYLVRSQHPKAATIENLMDISHGLGYAACAAGTVAEGLDLSLGQAGQGDLVVVTGSLFVVAEARSAWAERQSLPPYPSDPPDVY